MWNGWLGEEGMKGCGKQLMYDCKECKNFSYNGEVLGNMRD